MESLGWVKGDAVKESMPYLGKSEDSLVGEWIARFNIKGFSITEVLKIVSDGKFVSNLILSPNENHFVIKGIWSLSGTELRFTVITSTAPFALPGQTTIDLIEMISNEVLKVTSGRYEEPTTYVRAVPQFFESNQTLLPNSSGTDRTGSTGQSTIIKQDAYGLGVHMDQYGRAVEVVPQ
jgi:hypothetical protein